MLFFWLWRILYFQLLLQFGFSFLEIQIRAGIFTNCFILAFNKQVKINCHFLMKCEKKLRNSVCLFFFSLYFETLSKGFRTVIFCFVDQISELWIEFPSTHTCQNLWAACSSSLSPSQWWSSDELPMFHLCPLPLILSLKRVWPHYLDTLPKYMCIHGYDSVCILFSRLKRPGCLRYLLRAMLTFLSTHRTLSRSSMSLFFEKPSTENSSSGEASLELSRVGG